MLSLSSSSLPNLYRNPISLFPFNGHHYSFNINLSDPQPFLFTQTTRPTFITISATSLAEQSNTNEEEEEEYRVLSAMRTMYNNIVILESKTSIVLLLDDSGNVHSILHKSQNWTNSYWDEFSSLPAIVPKPGPVAIFGLGGGTVAHQLLHFWPDLVLDGWEVDGILVDQARMYFGLSQLETRGDHSGVGFVRVCVGDALSPAAKTEGGYAGIIVDLFANAEVLPELEAAETWLEMKEKLMPNGRIMVNCGGAKGGVGDHEWEVNSTIKALCKAFGEKFVNWKKNESGNYMAFTGPLPDLDVWSASVPEKLRSAVQLWRPCE